MHTGRTPSRSSAFRRGALDPRCDARGTSEAWRGSPAREHHRVGLVWVKFGPANLRQRSRSARKGSGCTKTWEAVLPVGGRRLLGPGRSSCSIASMTRTAGLGRRGARGGRRSRGTDGLAGRAGQGVGATWRVRGGGGTRSWGGPKNFHRDSALNRKGKRTRILQRCSSRLGGWRKRPRRSSKHSNASSGRETSPRPSIPGRDLTQDGITLDDRDR